jgi:hypothetical protein
MTRNPSVHCLKFSFKESARRQDILERLGRHLRNSRFDCGHPSLQKFEPTNYQSPLVDTRQAARIRRILSECRKRFLPVNRSNYSATRSR